MSPVDGTGVWSGNGAVYVNIATNEFDPSTAPIGVDLTLIYSINGAGCSESETCTFQITDNCPAEGGRF